MNQRSFFISRSSILLTAFIYCISLHALFAQFPLPQSSPLDLLPPNQATHTVLNSGDWTNPNTWVGGNVPNNRAKVFIPSGKTLTVDGIISTRIKIIRIQGKLQFSTTTNTSLKVETIVQDMTGDLEIGTANNPIPEGTNCSITIIDEGDIALNTDQWEKGMVLMGRTVAFGASKTAWSPVKVNPESGSTSLRLKNTPQGWNPGDRIVITGTDPVDATSDEVAVIKSVSGKTITLQNPLTKNHTTPAADLYVHVANLSRNIVIESESTANPMDRGHIMFMRTLDVDFQNVRLHKMGRTRKDVPIDDWILGEEDEFVNGKRTNIRGRYSIHFHRGGVRNNTTPALVKGCVVEDDPGWAYANHSANVDFDQNVSYNVIGGGFQTEAGDELGSFTNNIAIRTVNLEYPIRLEFPENAPDTREVSQDFAWQGDGFWIHGGGVTVSGNVASGSSGHGFIYWPEGLVEPGFPTKTFRNTFVPENLGLPNSINIVPEEDVVATGWVSIAGFQNNEAYSSGIGLATYYLHTTFFNDVSDYDPNYIATVYSVFDGFTGWNIDQVGIQLHFTERVTLKNIRLVNADADPSTIGLWASHYRAKEKQVFQDISIEGFGIGLSLPTQGTVTVSCGNLRNGINMYVPSVGLNPRDMLIDGITTAPDQRFNNPLEIKMEAKFIPPEDKFPAYFLLPDKTILNYGPYTNQRLYFEEQAANFTPIPSDSDPYTLIEDERFILSEFAAKTNQELQRDYQMSFGGTILPADAQSVVGIEGGKIHPWQNEKLNIPVCVDFRKENRVDEINNCIRAAGNNKVAGTMSNYNHPTGGCITTSNKEIQKAQPNIELFPNPTRGSFTISAALDQYVVEVINANGMIVQSTNQRANQFEINISDFPAGIYFVRIMPLSSGEPIIKKVIKTD